MTQPHLTVNEFEIIKEYLSANGSIESIPFTIKTWSIKLISEIERLRGLLKEHGGHTSWCSVHYCKPCSCGWSEIRKELDL